MPANLADHQEIKVVKTISGNSPATRSINEKASQTFLAGVPVQLAAGVVQEWDGATLANGICGFARAGGANLGSNGAGAPVPFGSVGFPGTTSTFGSVPNQASAKNIAHGAPMSDGRTLFELANDDSIFEAQIDSASGAAFASTQAMIGSKAGLTKDATGHWYVDIDKNNSVIIMAFHPNDPIGTNGARAWFSVFDSVQQLIT